MSFLLQNKPITNSHYNQKRGLHFSEMMRANTMQALPSTKTIKYVSINYNYNKYYVCNSSQTNKKKCSSSTNSASWFPILSTTTSLTLITVVAIPLQAKAVTLPKDDIVSSLTQVEKTIDKVQELSGSIFDTAKSVFETVKPSIDATVPILKQAGEQATKFASPAVSEASKKVQEAMQSSGFDTQPVLTAAKTVNDVAQQTTKLMEGAIPVASSTIETISTANPQTILIAGGALFLSYLLLPPIFSVIAFNFRGYKGELTPAQALDLICTNNYLMIDIRSEKDKNKAGIPRLPSNAKYRMISIPLEELPSKLKGIVRNAKKAEAEIATLKISYLKKINKGSNVVIMDSYSDSAKIVAKTLTSLGFKNCYIVSDGFSGGQGWLQSRLGVDSYNFSFAEVISPSRAISQRFATSSSTKLIAGGSD